MRHSQITIKPALPSDLLTLARIEALATVEEEFSAVALGPYRFSDAAMEFRAADLGQAVPAGERMSVVKAVITGRGRSEVILGFAHWTLCEGRTGSEEERRCLGTKEQWRREEREWLYKEEEEEPYGPGANQRLCEDAFDRSNELLARATGGWDYAKLFSLNVLPKYQHCGIGTMLLKTFLKEADHAGLQAVLGASPEGEGLYRKYGFVVIWSKDFKLWEYEGGEGMGVARHCIMHRLGLKRQCKIRQRCGKSFLTPLNVLVA